MEPKKVLITGGAGFIGSHLSEALLKNGCSVTVIDDLSTGKWSNVDHLEQDPNFRIIITSAADSDLLEKEVPKHDFVYHLASAVGVKLIIEEPVKTIETIFHSTDLVLKACSKYRRPVSIRDGFAIICEAGAGRKANNGLPGWKPTAVLLLGARRSRRTN